MHKGVAGAENMLAFRGTVSVTGLGYVGLPLACLAGYKGFRVRGIDLDRQRVERLRRRTSYIADVPDAELERLLDKRVISFHTDYLQLPDSDIIVVCVPTPLDSGGNPDYSCLEAAVGEISGVLRSGQLVIIESTVAPGTTEKLVLPILEKSGLKAGSDFYLSYSPERLDPGNREYGVANIPKLVSGLTAACRRLAGAFYEQLGLTVVPVASLAAAEMAKLLENTYRDVNIALINEMARVCRAGGINIWQVVDAASTKPFGFQAFYPGPGVGGHCIPVDSVYYTSWARRSGIPASLAEQARLINTTMPEYIKTIITETLAELGKTLPGSKVMVLGVTYKKDIYDIRESPVIKLIGLLLAAGADVVFHDPSVEQIHADGRTVSGVPLEKSVLSGQDCVVLAVNHSVYDLDWVYRCSPLIVDFTNAMAGFDKSKLRIL
jgi:UDP-N-acetyl-D-glucosamine dehydrogenase